MSDQGVREIQLSGKQLVFLFMAAVVFTVVVFLLGVSVGRGVRDNTGGTVMASGTAAPKSADLPPPTKTGPGDLTYDKSLTAKPGEAGKAPAAQEPPPATPPPAPTPTPTPTPTSTPTPTPTPTPPPPPAETKSPPPAGSKSSPAAGAPYWVQVGRFKDRSNAEKLQRELKAEGFAVTMQEAAGLMVVRVGPFDDKAQADATAKRLARHKAMVTR